MPIPFAGVLAGIAAEVPGATVPSSSPTAEIITVTLAGIAAIITALAGFNSLRRRRQAEVDALGPPPLTDLEDGAARLRERLAGAEARLTPLVRLPERVAALEARAHAMETEIGDLAEQLRLRRAVDVITEVDASPRRRRRPESPS